MKPIIATLLVSQLLLGCSSTTAEETVPAPTKSEAQAVAPAGETAPPTNPSATPSTPPAAPAAGEVPLQEDGAALPGK